MDNVHIYAIFVSVKFILHIDQTSKIGNENTIQEELRMLGKQQDTIFCPNSFKIELRSIDRQTSMKTDLFEFLLRLYVN